MLSEIHCYGFHMMCILSVKHTVHVLYIYIVHVRYARNRNSPNSLILNDNFLFVRTLSYENGLDCPKVKCLYIFLIGTFIP